MELVKGIPSSRKGLVGQGRVMQGCPQLGDHDQEREENIRSREFLTDDDSSTIQIFSIV